MLDIFVTGTQHNVGKTFITAGLATTMQSLGYQTCVYKPVETNSVEKKGFMQSPDLAYVKNLDPYVKISASYLLQDGGFPAIAAESANISVDTNQIRKDYENISKGSDCIVTEGSRGILSPYGLNFCEADIIKMLNIPMALIVKPNKDALNQALLTINEAQKRDIIIRGVIINNVDYKNQKQELKYLPRLIEEYSNIKVLGIVGDFSLNQNFDPNILITEILNGIDIESVFDVRIEKLNV